MIQKFHQIGRVSKSTRTRVGIQAVGRSSFHPIIHSNTIQNQPTWETGSALILWRGKLVAAGVPPAVEPGVLARRVGSFEAFKGAY
jgi:hypothetical protein